MNDYIMKRCSKCGEEKPATREYFLPCKDCKQNLKAMCKACRRAYQREYRKKNNTEIKAYMHQYYLDHKEAHRKRMRQYVQDNYEKLRQQWQLYREQNRSQVLASQHRHYIRNKSRVNEKARQYRQLNRHVDKAGKLRYRARKRALPDTFTSTQWLLCLDYWHYCCAICGCQLRDLFGEVKPHADHWIPLSYKGTDNPGTVPENMICMCTSCNTSKNDSLPKQWLSQRFNKGKTAEILQRIEAYFQWIARQA
jgi:hypothetical protein